MILREIIPVLIALSCASSAALAQEPVLRSSVVQAHDINKAVLPINAVKFLGLGVEGRLGTGFCLDADCRFVGTNYHVAITARPRKIRGQKIIHQYLATGPGDEGATLNDVPSVTPMKYTLSRDLAIFELRHPLSHLRGVAFSLDDLQVGQEIDIYAYPQESINPIRSLLKFHGSFKGQTTTGLLAFDYSLSPRQAIRPGASGGIVVDSESQQIVGILSGIAKNNDGVALAVPVQFLADFVSKVQPYLAQILFPPTQAISPISADLYPKFASPLTSALEHRPEETPEVKLLRSKAQLLADNMRNFIAVQTYVWGSGNGEPRAVAAYEVRVVEGSQRFREYPGGKKERRDPPLPNLNNAMSSGGEWSELPQMVGTKLRLKIHQAPDAVVNDRRIKVFQYQASVEDGRCIFRSILDFGLFSIHKDTTVASYGEVWTDEDTNILRMSEHCELTGKWRNYQAVVTYGWLQRNDEPRRLVPLTISTQAELNKKLYWCRGQFTRYQLFSVQVKMPAD